LQIKLLKEIPIYIIILLLIGTCIGPVTSGFNKKTLQISDLNIERDNNKSNNDFSNNQLSLLGNPPGVEWSKVFGAQYCPDEGHSVQQTTDDGYIITGYTTSYGAGLEDIWVIKTDANGNSDWSNTFGGSSEDIGWCVQQTNDGGYVITGDTTSYGSGSWNIWLIKIDSGGNEEWNKTYGGTSEDTSRFVQQTTDGGYIIAGQTGSYGAGNMDIWLIKTDQNGNEEWNKTYGGGLTEHCYSAQQTNDGGYVIIGETESYGAGDWDAWLVKTDQNGDEEWNKTYGGSGNEWGDSVQQTTDGGYIIAGIKTYAIWLIKVDAVGNEEWDNIFDQYPSWNSMHSVQQTTDGGYFIIGDMEIEGMPATTLIKTYENGIEKWRTTPSGPLYSIPYFGRQTSDGGFIITGIISAGDVFFGNLFLLKMWPEPSPSFKLSLLFGKINNLSFNEDYSFFTAENIWQLQFRPFNFTKYNSSELFIISNNYLGILNQNLIIGVFKEVI